MTEPSPPTSPPPPTPPTSDDRIVSGSLPCIRCSYDLNTCALSNRCPECGNPASLSLQSLWLEETGYLRTLRRGVLGMFIGALIGPGICLLAVVVSIWGSRDGPRGLVPVAAIALVAGPVFASRGVWKLLRPRREGIVWSSGLVPGAKWLAVIFTVSFTISALIIAGLILDDSGSTAFRAILVIVLIAGESWCARNLLVLAYIRSLAHVANMSRIAGAVLILQVSTCAIAAGGLIIGAFAWFPPTAFSPTGNFGLVLMFGYFAWLAICFLWLITWPIFLARFGASLKDMIKHHELRGRPLIIEAASAPTPIAPPTFLPSIPAQPPPTP